MGSCSICGGPLMLLGPMGAVFLAVRCRDCGMDFLVPDPEIEEEEVK